MKTFIQIISVPFLVLMVWFIYKMLKEEVTNWLTLFGLLKKEPPKDQNLGVADMTEDHPLKLDPRDAFKKPDRG